MQKPREKTDSYRVRFARLRKSKTTSNWFSRFLTFLWQHIQILTVIGIVVPIYLSHYQTYYYEKHDLAVIIVDESLSDPDHQFSNVIFRNRGNQKEVLSQIRFVVSPASGAMVIINPSERPTTIASDPKIWLKVPGKTGFEIGPDGIYYTLEVPKVTTEVIPSFDTISRRAEVSLEQLKPILSLFTPDSKLNMGFDISIVDSNGNLFHKRIIYYEILVSAPMKRIYLKQMPCLTEILPSKEKPYKLYSSAIETLEPNSIKKVKSN